MKKNFKKQVMAAGLLIASTLSLPNVSLHSAQQNININNNHAGALNNMQNIPRLTFTEDIANLEQAINNTIKEQGSGIKAAIKNIVESSLLVITSFGKAKKIDLLYNQHSEKINVLKKDLKEVIEKINNPNDPASQAARIALGALRSLKKDVGKLRPGFIKKTVIALTKLIIVLAPLYLLDSYFNEGLLAEWTKKSIIGFLDAISKNYQFGTNLEKSIIKKLMNLDNYIKSSLSNIISQAGSISNTTKEHMQNSLDNFFAHVRHYCGYYNDIYENTIQTCKANFAKIDPRGLTLRKTSWEYRYMNPFSANSRHVVTGNTCYPINGETLNETNWGLGYIKDSCSWFKTAITPNVKNWENGHVDTHVDTRIPYFYPLQSNAKSELPELPSYLETLIDLTGRTGGLAKNTAKTIAKSIVNTVSDLTTEASQIWHDLMHLY